MRVTRSKLKQNFNFKYSRSFEAWSSRQNNPILDETAPIAMSVRRDPTLECGHLSFLLQDGKLRVQAGRDQKNQR